MCDWICDIIFFIQNLLLTCWENIDISKIIAIVATIIAWLTYLPIKGHKISILPISFAAPISDYTKEIILFNHKNKTEVICKLYAKLNDGTFLCLEAYKAGQFASGTIDINNPLLLEPYQNKKVFIRRASYYKQFSRDTENQLYIDIENKITGYYVILSDGKFLKTEDLYPNKKIIEFERNNSIVHRQICRGKILQKKKIISQFTLYNMCGSIVAIFSDCNSLFLDVKKEYSEKSIKQLILKNAKLPNSYTIEFDCNINELLQTLKQSND